MSRRYFEAKFGRLDYVFKQLCYNPRTMVGGKDSLNQSYDLIAKNAENTKVRIILEHKLETFANTDDATAGSPKLDAINDHYRETAANIAIADAEKALVFDPQNERKKAQLIAVRVRKERVEDDKLAHEKRPGYTDAMDELNPVILGLKSAYYEFVQLNYRPASEMEADINAGNLLKVILSKHQETIVAKPPQSRRPQSPQGK